MILCIVRVTGGRRSLCKFFQEKPGWSAVVKNDDEDADDETAKTTNILEEKN